MKTASQTAVRPQVNVRHDIEPALVQAQIDKKIAHYERERTSSKGHAQKVLADYEKAKADGTSGQWSRPPQNPDDIDLMYDKWIEQERTYYALVRVIELPQKGKRFILVYGDADDATVTHGTGPFESLEAATDWFLGSGR